MDVLILGGTRFVGRHAAQALLAAGHRVTVFNRGRSPDALPPAVQRLHGDRDGDLAPLAGGRWDACLDTCGYFPRQLRAACAALAGVRRYVFVSAVRTYAPVAQGPVTEDHPLLPPAGDDVAEIDDSTYGPLKVACERVVQAAFGERATVLRPQVLVGPHDDSGRVDHWLARPEGPFPGDGRDRLQVADVRDLARFVVTALERDLPGVFNIAGHRITWAEFVALLGHAAPRWVPVANPRFQDWPLYRPPGSPLAPLMDVSSARAQAAGLVLTPAAETFAAMRTDGRSSPPPGGR